MLSEYAAKGVQRIATTIALLSITFYACSRAGSAPKLEGAWGTDCGNASVLEVKIRSESVLTLNLNQISVEVAMKEKGGKTSIQFIKPADLGAGGNAIDWRAISTRESIGEIRLSKSNEAHLTWLGLYDTKAKTRVWVKEAEFWNEGGDIVLKKCP